MSTKMKTLEEQHQDYQKHIAVLKESLCAKEEHYTMLQTDVSSVHIQANRKVQRLLITKTTQKIASILFNFPILIEHDPQHQCRNDESSQKQDEND